MGKQWKRPNYPSKDSKGWKKDSDKYGTAYSHDPYERTYGKAYSMHKDEPKGYKGYSSKDEPKDHKYEPSTHSKRDYSSKDYKGDMKPKHDEPSKHEQPKDYKKSSKDYDNDKHDGKYGTAYSMLAGETENASCPSDDDFDMNAPCD